VIIFSRPCAVACGRGNGAIIILPILVEFFYFRMILVINKMQHLVPEI
jgi:hypothetical protein